MKLRWSPTSPFARKVMVMIREKGIKESLTLEQSNPLSREDRAATPNPLGKIPCLVTDGGEALYDSSVILQYLDAVCDGPELLAPDGPARWTALRREALADGMIEAMVACFVESLRKPERQSAGWLAHNRSVALNAAAALEPEAPDLVGRIDIGTISVAVALAYADHAFADEDWRSASPELARWFEDFNARPSMKETVLVDARDFS